jgi:hypothetical protein
MMNNDTPDNLAEYVFKELKISRITGKKPSEAILKELFNTLYYTSLETEEGQFITVTITLINPDKEIELEDEEEPIDNWQLYKFEKPIELTVKNLVKLSKAADQWSSSLAVYYDEIGDLYIHGMIDQAIHFQRFLVYERDQLTSHPGIIQVMINGIGTLNVMLEYQPIASLNKNTLVRQPRDVFKLGPVSEFLKECTSYRRSTLSNQLDLDPEDAAGFSGLIFNYFVEAISRILLKIRNYHHGGAIVITKSQISDLKIKYPIKYDRIQKAVLHLVDAISKGAQLNERVNGFKKKGREMPISVLRDYKSNELDFKESYDELIGAIRFVSSLSCVDGTIVLSPHLDVVGFGAIITDKDSVPEIYLSKTSTIASSAVRMNASHFGTRHQSMFSYCNKHPESVAFVVSQDGEIRAIKNVEGKIYMWDNIKVYNFKRSLKMPRNAPRPTSSIK